MNKLSENLIQEACDIFLVNREWLEGHSDEIYTVKHFYKSPEKFEQFVDELKLTQPESHFSGVLLTSNNNKKFHSSVLLIEEILEKKTVSSFLDITNVRLRISLIGSAEHTLQHVLQ